MKILPVHFAPFLSEYAMNVIGVQVAPAKTVSPIPFSKQHFLLVFVKEASVASLNAVVINSLCKGRKVLLNVSSFGIHTKHGFVRNALFSNLCVFISVFEKPYFTTE